MDPKPPRGKKSSHRRDCCNILPSSHQHVVSHQAKQEKNRRHVINYKVAFSCRSSPSKQKKNQNNFPLCPQNPQCSNRNIFSWPLGGRNLIEIILIPNRARICTIPVGVELTPGDAWWMSVNRFSGTLMMSSSWTWAPRELYFSKRLGELWAI